MNHSPSPRRAATRERLVAAAIPVIAAKGVLGASVEEICEAAGFTRGAFYSNFDSKDELCEAILDAQCTAYVAAAREAIENITPGRSVADQVSEAATRFIASTAEDPDTVLVMSELRLYAAREPSVREAFQRVDRATGPVFSQLVEEGLRTHGARLTVPISEALSLMHAVYDQTALDQLVHGQAPDSPLAAKRLELVLRSLIEDEPAPA